MAENFNNGVQVGPSQEPSGTLVYAFICPVAHATVSQVPCGILEAFTSPFHGSIHDGSGIISLGVHVVGVIRKNIGD